MNTAGNMTAIGIVSAVAYFVAEFVVGTSAFANIDPSGHLMPLVVGVITSLIVPIYKFVDRQLEQRNLDILPDYEKDTSPYPFESYGSHQYEASFDPSIEPEDVSHY